LEHLSAHWSWKNPDEAECTDHKQHGRNRHRNRVHSIVTGASNRCRIGVLNNRSHQASMPRAMKQLSEISALGDRMGGIANSSRLQIVETLPIHNPNPISESEVRIHSLSRRVLDIADLVIEWVPLDVS
jgi:hypothetical protein